MTPKWGQNFIKKLILRSVLKVEIHNYERQYLASLKNLERSKISDKNKRIILEFVDELILEGISKPRIIKYIQSLNIIAKWVKLELDKVSVEDLKRFVAYLQQKSDYSVWTKQSYKVIIRKFYTWVNKKKSRNLDLSWISLRISRSDKKLPTDEEMITESDVENLIKSAKHPRDKALIATLWESGARISELGNLKLKNVIFDQYGVLMYVNGKTGPRKIRLIYSTPYLSTILGIIALIGLIDKETKDVFKK